MDQMENSSGASLLDVIQTGLYIGGQAYFAHEQAEAGQPITGIGWAPAGWATATPAAKQTTTTPDNAKTLTLIAVGLVALVIVLLVARR